ncbi:two pore domain potassium channel family protein [Flavobacterium sp. KJJ]|uniref:two pore domain potassium channel family protein n=1 Tax=Flavobacterium sp. KJJ TaxID=1270193 RepID=UPI000690B997|nr:two pore domain potassium channel family protein [Flavobacterium sp. KJJ]
MLIELALTGKFIVDIVKRLKSDKAFRTIGFLLFVLILVGTMFFWLVEGLPFLKALAYSVGTLSLNSPYDFRITFSTIGIVFNIIYIFIGVGVYLIFVMEVGRTIIAAHEDFEKKQAEKKALKKAQKEARLNESN